MGAELENFAGTVLIWVSTTKMTTKTTAEVWGKLYEISVYKKSKTVWIATGEYMGEQVRTKGSTESDAITQWREAARYKGN